MARQKRRIAMAPFGSSPESQKANKFRKLNYTETPCSTVEAMSPHVAKLMSAAAALRPGIPQGTGLLPCRAVERKKIAAHLQAGVEQGGTSKVLYVSGMPGTGKTAIVLEVLEQLAESLPLTTQFKLVHINAMRLGAPAQVFREIADQMDIQTNNNESCNDVTEFFYTRRMEDPVVVLLIDEVDCLVTPTQAVLYKLFDWLGMPNARLVVAAISNTMDLPERLLPRVASRFYIERVDFAPYSKSQLYEILCSRLKRQKALDAFGDVVLRLCAARVAGATGDIRKALQVCRRAVETRLLSTSLDGPFQPVTIADLESAEKELILANPIAQAVMALTDQARRFLAALVIELRSKESEAVLLRQVEVRFQRLLAIVAVDHERGQGDAKAPAMTGDTTFALEIDEVVGMFVQRLEAMNIISKQAHLPFSTERDSGGQVLSLRSLDLEDLTNTLLKVEADPTLCELLEGGRPDAAQTRIYTPID